MLRPFSKVISKEYRELAKIYHTSDFKKDISNILLKEKIFYGNSDNYKIANYFSQPSFFSNKDISYLQEIINNLNNLISETYVILNKKPHYFKYLGFMKNSLDFEEDSNNPAYLFRVDCGILKETKKLIFMEFNTNNPGGLYNSDGIEKILLEHDPVLKQLKNKYNFSTFNRFDSFAETIRENFEIFKEKNKKNYQI